MHRAKRTTGVSARHVEDEELYDDYPWVRPNWLTPTEAAKLLGVHRRTLDREVARGRLKRDPVIHTFDLDEMESLIEVRYQAKREALIQRPMGASHQQRRPTLPDEFDGLPF